MHASTSYRAALGQVSPEIEGDDSSLLSTGETLGALGPVLSSPVQERHGATE